MWRWLQTSGCPYLHLRATMVCISQTVVPLRMTLLLHRLGEAVVVGLANTRQPQTILSNVLQTGKRFCFLGVAITSLGARLLKNHHALSEEAASTVPDGTFMTIALDDERMEVSFRTPAGGTWSCTARHGGEVDAASERYCAAISDAPCDIVSCWSSCEKLMHVYICLAQAAASDSKMWPR